MHRRILIIPAFIALGLLLASRPGSAAPATYAVQSGGASSLRFVSKAPMETFEGKTNQVSGSIVLDPARFADSLVVRLEVELASLDTGIELRNRHMRENHLHTDRHPRAVFVGGALGDLSATSLSEGQTVTGKIAGTMTLHGVEQPIEAPFEMTLQSGLLHVVSRFRIKLADYGIPRPQFLVLKLDDAQSVTVDLLARSQP